MKKTSTLIAIALFASFASLAQTTQRIPLFEMFSSSTCGPCVAANSNMKTVFNANPNKYTNIKYQMNWPGSGDPYYTSEGGTRRSFYNVNSIPMMFVEGTLASPTSYTSSDLQNAYAIPAEMVISGTYSVVGQTVTVNSSYNPLKNFASGAYRAHAVVVEKTTTGNAASNGETIFYNVMKKMIPNQAGGTLGTTLTANTPVNFSNLMYNFGTSSTVENFNNLAVVIFAQENVSHTVLQSAWATLLTSVTSVEKPGNGITALFPNPTSTSANLSYQLTESRNVKVSILNTLGQEVYSSNEGEKAPGNYDLEISTIELPTGLYFVNLTLGDHTHTSKLSVQK